MAPESWTQAEVVRALERIESAVGDVRTELRSQRAEFVPREVYEADQRNYVEFKQLAATDIVNLEASMSRLRKETEDAFEAHRQERVVANRWVVGVVLTGTAVLVSIINAMGLGVS